MTAASDDQLGFAPDDDAPIPYMARTRDYYAAIGYDTPYRWAHYVERAVSAAAKAARPIPRRHRHHRGPVRSRQGRSGPRREIQWRRQILFGL